MSVPERTANSGLFCRSGEGLVRSGEDDRGVRESGQGRHAWRLTQEPMGMSEGWYRYGDSNPGPVAENHVS